MSKPAKLPPLHTSTPLPKIGEIGEIKKPAKLAPIQSSSSAQNASSQPEQKNPLEIKKPAKLAPIKSSSSAQNISPEPEQKDPFTLANVLQPIQNSQSSTSKSASRSSTPFNNSERDINRHIAGFLTPREMGIMAIASKEFSEDNEALLQQQRFDREDALEAFKEIVQPGIFHQQNAKALSDFLQNEVPNLQLKPEEGVAVLLLACEQNQYELAALLLKAGTSPNIMNPNNKSLLQVTLDRGSRETVGVLLKDERLKEKIKNIATTDAGEKLTLHACSDNYPELLKLLLDAGADPNSQKIKQESLLSSIISSAVPGTNNDSKVRTIEVLLADQRTDINAKNINSGNTALYHAISLGINSIVKILLDNGANPTLGGQGITPLQAATLLGNQEAVALLAAKLESRKTDTRRRTTALHQSSTPNPKISATDHSNQGSSNEHQK